MSTICRRAAFALLLATFTNAHVAGWAKGMYCINGTSGTENRNTNDAVLPLYKLQFSDWWMHHSNGCDQFPPAYGDYLQVPAGGSFTVEMANNRAQTTLSYDGANTSDWPDGKQHPEDYNVEKCITSPNIHTQNRTRAAGSAFAISYESELSRVTPENLIVFSVLPNSPWKRLASFSVPAAMPACPRGGCICVWGWVPNGCGEANMYMLPYRCQVTNASGGRPLQTPKAPVWCEDDPSKCVKGAKQMVYWNQLSGNNVEVSGNDLSGHWKSPGYNSKMGFDGGAQNDIFA